MESRVEKTTRIVLSLTEEEAQWLKGLVQNPVGGLNYESLYNNNMRQRFWDALEGVNPGTLLKE